MYNPATSEDFLFLPTRVRLTSISIKPGLSIPHIQYIILLEHKVRFLEHECFSFTTTPRTRPILFGKNLTIDTTIHFYYA